MMQPPLIHDEIVVDLFAGGGGASLGIELAIGRAVDVAVNHDADAISMHARNHPGTTHYCESVYTVDPVAATQRRPVGLLWASPDCTHHSRAKGGKPVCHKRRSLAWAVVKWARAVRPRVICLENVTEFEQWGPLTREGLPDKAKMGQHFAHWKKALQRLGYKVEHKYLRASDYGVPTIRQRLFLVARCDGQPIQWPDPVTGADTSAASVIDWSIPMCSIFADQSQAKAWAEKHGMHTPKRPLAAATLARIASGIAEYVIDPGKRFIAPARPSGDDNAHLVAAFMAQHNGGYCHKQARQLAAPVSTITTVGTQRALVCAHLTHAQHGGRSRTLHDPAHTLTASVKDQNQVVCCHMVTMKSSQRADSGASEPVRTICAGANHAALVAAFLAPYYKSGSGQTGRAAGDPAPTITTVDRLQLVTATIDDQTYVVTDVAMRMLTPREQFRAQGFPDTYQIDSGHDGRLLSKRAQTRMCGNSVCPPLAEAVVRANYCAGFKRMAGAA